MFAKRVMGVLALGAVLVTAGQAWALSTPTALLQGIGINPYRDLDGQTPRSGVRSATEDSVRCSDGYVGPAYGGQAYDWEGLYAWRSGTTGYVVISTGFPILPSNISRSNASSLQSPDGGIAHTTFSDSIYYAGDLLFDTGDNGTWDYGISMGAYTSATGRSGLTYGTLYAVDHSLGYNGTGTYRPEMNESAPWLGAGTVLTALNYSAESITVTQQTGEDMNGAGGGFTRYLAAFAIDLSLYPAFNLTQDIHWTMECGNDEGDLLCQAATSPTSSHGQVPEPLSLLLLGACAGGYGIWRRRRAA